MQLNNYITNLIDDMKSNMHRGNDYSSRPTIRKGVNTTKTPTLPFMEVSIDKPVIESYLGDKLSMDIEIAITCHCKAEQEDENDKQLNNLYEDLIYYLYNDCVYTDQIDVLDESQRFYGRLERGDAVVSFLQMIRLHVEYTLTDINS
jgi:hypothetical protein